MMKVLAFENNLVETSGQEQRKSVTYCLLKMFEYLAICVWFRIFFFIYNQQVDWSGLQLKHLLMKLFFYYECR